ncbi:MAG: ATP-binding protein [bacterium]
MPPTCEQPEHQLDKIMKENRLALTELENCRREQAELRAAKGLAEDVVRGLPGIFCLLDRQGRFVRWNRNCEELGEYSAEEIAGMTALDYFEGEDKTKAAKAVEQVFNQGRTFVELDVVTKTGKKIRTSFKGVQALVQGVPYLIGIGMEMGEGREAVRVIKASEEKLAEILQPVADYMFILDEDLTIVWSKPTANTFFGQDLVGRTCHEALRRRPERCEPCIVKKAFAEGKYHIEYENQLIGTDGTRLDFWIMVSVLTRHPDGSPKMFFGTCRDITEKKALEAEAMRASRLASIGELAAGVAHEINNPINGIINYAQILMDQNEEEGRADETPARIMKEAERVAKIVRNLLSFARKQAEGRGPARVQSILGDALDLMKREVRKDGIHLILDLPADLPEIRAQAQQIQQVFLNVLSNARYALNKRYPISHEDKVLEIRGELAQSKGQEWVRTVFRDRGIGIPENVLDKVCDPFFSTKPRGEGTGLGLSVSYGIVRDHEGSLQINSVEGSYTEVLIDLPVHPQGQPNCRNWLGHEEENTGHR